MASAELPFRPIGSMTNFLVDDYQPPRGFASGFILDPKRRKCD